MLQPWAEISERLRRYSDRLYRVSIYLAYKPKVLTALEPWAEVSQRLRRIFKLEPNTLFQLGVFQTEPTPLFQVGVLFPRLNQHGQI